MPAFENNLLILFFVLLGLAVPVGLGFALWEPWGRRAWRYFRLWWQQDKLADAQARAEKDARRQARRELAEACGEELPQDETPQAVAAQLKSDCAPSAPTLPRARKADQTQATETPKISLIQRK